MAIDDPINSSLASLNRLTDTWTLEYLAEQQAQQERDKQSQELANLNQAFNENEQILLEQNNTMGNWDQVLPGVYKQVKDGKTSYTNVLDAGGVPSMNAIVGLNGAYQAPSGTPLPTDATAQNTSSGFQAKLAEIEKQNDPRTKLRMFFDLQSSLADESSKAYQQAIDQASSKLGLPQQEALLAENERLDRSDPRWAANRTDSNETAAQRRLVEGIRARVNAEAQTYLKTNSGLNSMTAKMESMAKLLDYDLRQADRVANREDQQANALFLKKEQQAYQREKDMLELSPNMKARLLAIDPSLAQKPEGMARDEAMADYYGAVKSDPNIKAILNAPVETLIAASILDGNEQAERIVVAEETANNPAADVASVRATIAKMRALTQNDDMIGQILLQQAGGNKEDPSYAGYNALLMAKKSGAVTKAQNEAFTETKYNIARRLIQQETTDKFVNNVAAWGISDPALQAAVEAARVTTGKTDFNEVAAAYLGGIQGPERAAKAEQLRKSLYTAADQYSNSLLTRVNPDVIWNQWLISKARMSLAQRFSMARNDAASVPFLENPTPVGLTATAWKSAFPLQSLLLNMNKDMTNGQLNQQQ